MRRIGISMFAFSLSFLVLLGSGNFTVGKMVCLGNGHAKYSLGSAKDCCGDKAIAHQAFEGSCCDLKNVTYSLDHFSTSEKISLSAQTLDIFFTVPILAFHRPSSMVHQPFIDPPPPDPKDALYLIGSLLL